MSIKNRLQQLEKKQTTKGGALVVVYSKNGIVTKGEFAGMTLEQVESRINQNDTLLNVVPASDDKTVLYIPDNERD